MSERDPSKKALNIWSLAIGGIAIVLIIVTGLVTHPDLHVKASKGDEEKQSSINAKDGKILLENLQTNTLHLLLQGVVSSPKQTNIISGVDGRIVTITSDFVPGNNVSEGTVLAELQDVGYRAKLATAQAVLEQAKLDVAEEQAKALKAVKKSYGSNGKSGSESELVLRVPQRRAVNARLQAAEIAVEEAHQHLNETVICAPYNGTITSCNVVRGEFVKSGQILGVIAPDQERAVVCELSAMQYSLLPPRMKIPVKAQAHCADGTCLEWQGYLSTENSASTLNTHGNVSCMVSLTPNECQAAMWRVAPVHMPVRIALDLTVPQSVWIPESSQNTTVVQIDNVLYRVIIIGRERGELLIRLQHDIPN